MHITHEHIGQQRLRNNQHQIFENIGRLVQQTLWLEDDVWFPSGIIFINTLGLVVVVDFESLHLEPARTWTKHCELGVHCQMG